LDWCLEPDDRDAFRGLRREFESYLRRHADPGNDVGAAVLVLSELVGNAVRHATGLVWVNVDWGRARPTLTVHDLGPGFRLGDVASADDVRESGRGLLIASALTERLEVASKRAGGSQVSAVLPVERAVEASHAPPVRRHAALPDPAEADPDGTFPKEAFLCALVVELAQTVELEAGPSLTESLVAQVGTDVGYRMEEAYRRARGLVDRLSPEQIADLYVRLKAAIDGDFYVLEASEERIVLGNRRCPFGDLVKRSPALCRMTSSVFGGIAARNHGASRVQLEERIAVGDPECRVSVWLGDAAASRPDYGHRYSAPSAV
jgi:anti-sigma regulatory factor (Ser/Thr protein kinase)